MDKYNGWNSYETWLFVIWSENDYNTCKYFEERAEYWAKEYNDDLTEAKYQFSKELIEYINEIYYNDIPTYGPIADLLRAAIQRIDFYNIADHWIEDIL